MCFRDCCDLFLLSCILKLCPLKQPPNQLPSELMKTTSLYKEEGSLISSCANKGPISHHWSIISHDFTIDGWRRIPKSSESHKSKDALSFEPEPMGTCAIPKSSTFRQQLSGLVEREEETAATRWTKNWQKEEFSVTKRTNKTRIKMHQANKYKSIIIKQH